MFLTTAQFALAVKVKYPLTTVNHARKPVKAFSSSKPIVERSKGKTIRVNSGEIVAD